MAGQLRSPSTTRARSVSSMPSPRSPSPTRFPYTTLFRSSNALTSTIQGNSIGQSQHLYGFEFTIPIHLKRFRWIGIVDRKSTRLNSSHTVISYAVFCLKKKKKKHDKSKQKKNTPTQQEHR